MKLNLIKYLNLAEKKRKKKGKSHSVSLSGHALLALAKLWSRDRYWGM